MAQIALSGIVSNIRGSLGGSVFSNCLSGPTLRNNLGQRSSNTTAQQLVRSAFTYISQSWGAMPQDVLAQWNAAALNHFRTSKVGKRYPMSGKTFFTFIASRSLLCNKPIPSIPPVLVPYQSPVPTFTDDKDAGTCTLSLSRSLDATEYIVLRCTPFLSPGTTSILRKPMRIIKILSLTDTFPINIVPFIKNKNGNGWVGFNPVIGKIADFIKYATNGTMEGWQSWDLAENWYNWAW